MVSVGPRNVPGDRGEYPIAGAYYAWGCNGLGPHLTVLIVSIVDQRFLISWKGKIINATIF